MAIDTARYQAIRNKTTELLELAQRLYGVDIKPTISFNLRGRVAGWAGCKHCRIKQQRVYTLRFNSDLIQGKHFEDIRDETVAHEIAHLVCFARPELGRKHDGGWQRVCIALGGNGNTRHDYEVTYAGGGWDYIATCGTKITVSNVIHQRIQAGQSRMLRRTGGRVNRSCQFARQGSTMPVATQVREVQPAPQPVQRQPVQPAQGISKAEQVRAWIREAKRANEMPSSVVLRAINVLGMGRSQAHKYVSENWSRA
jgi:predicted SprT family Zn-dependent metalloprotease